MYLWIFQVTLLFVRWLATEIEGEEWIYIFRQGGLTFLSTVLHGTKDMAH